MSSERNANRRVIIVGGGFAGLAAAKALADAPVDVTLIDRTNHHLFQPLLYQVAMAGLSPADIAAPIRKVLRHQKNASVLLGEVVGVDLEQRRVHARDDRTVHALPYDHLVLAMGARTSYFGNDAWREHAIGLKTIDDAIEIRRRVLVAFEAAEREPEGAERDGLLTFAVIGGGPTGVELAGALRELAHFVLRRDFRRIDSDHARVVLIEGDDRLLQGMDPASSDAARAQLEDLGVEVRLGDMVTGVDAEGVQLGDDHLRARTVLWSAGVEAVPLTRELGVEVDRGGRVKVKPDCSVPGHPEVFVVGDAATLEGTDGRPLPGVSPVAMQQGEYVARLIAEHRLPEQRAPFRYHDKGQMATVGRRRAVAETRRVRLKGFLAWMAWLLVHVWYLIGFRNRVAVLLNWTWQYATYQRGARLITGDRLGAHRRPKAADEEAG
ncbi:MAG: NAD(P)/FAD-dependent oxidoreductase [Myxococcales bacterium]|nr:NAD(P)/FAD-dependent oxidoreductase [Myxococcales bacterium]